MKVILFAVLALIVGACSTPQKRNERWYQERWCKTHGGQIEVVMADKTRCDCLTSSHAIEFDFVRKWAEAIGQSLNYARLSGKQPGIVLICGPNHKDKKLFKRASARVRGMAKLYSLPITLWNINCD